MKLTEEESKQLDMLLKRIADEKIRQQTENVVKKWIASTDEKTEKEGKA